MSAEGNTDNGPVFLSGQRYLALCGISVPLVLSFGVVVAGLSWEGYDHRTQVISDLGGTLAPHPAILNVSFFVVGLSIVGFAFGLARSMKAAGAGLIGPSLVGFLGVTWAIMPLFPCTTVACRSAAFTDVTHLLIVNSGLLAFTIGSFVLSRSMRAHPGWRPLANYTTVTAVAALVTLLATYVAVGAPDEFHLGAVQRVNGLIVFGWTGVAGVRLWNLSRGVRETRLQAES